MTVTDEPRDVEIWAVWNKALNQQLALIDGHEIPVAQIRVERPVPRPKTEVIERPEPAMLWLGIQLGDHHEPYLTMKTQDNGEYTLIRRDELAELRRRGGSA